MFSTNVLEEHSLCIFSVEVNQVGKIPLSQCGSLALKMTEMQGKGKVIPVLSFVTWYSCRRPENVITEKYES
jgi:hypothetical protein